MSPTRNILPALASVLIVAHAHVQAAIPTIALKPICLQQIHAPTEIVTARDGSGRLFVCDQVGKIYIIQGGMLLPTPFLNIANPGNTPPDNGPGPVIGVGTGYTERGLLGLAFHPGFANMSSPGYRKFYVNYSAPSTQATLNPVGAGGTTNNVTVIAEYQVSLTDPNMADPGSGRIVLTYGQPQFNHNGGHIEFGPDELLYIASGDGGGSMDNQLGHTEGVTTQPAAPNQRVTGGLGNGQDRRTLLGKILRIDPLGTNGPGGTYGIPAANPFVGQTQDFVDNSLDGPMRGEIFAYGLRNPWKFSFDSSFGGAPRLICADVGQGDVEEIDFIVSGGNYGWRIKEGSVDFDTPNAYLPVPTGIGLPPVIGPIAEYAHPTATLTGTGPMPKLGTSITGGYVYRGSAIPALQGKYLCADYALNGIGSGGGIFIGVEETSPGVYSTPAQVTVVNPLPTVARIYTFGVDEAGEMYVGTKTTAGVLSLDPPTTGRPAGGIYKIVKATYTSALPAAKDNTIFSEEVPATNTYLSDALGYLYSGRTGGVSNSVDFRRALIAFNVAAGIPAGAVIQSAQLQLRVMKIGPTAGGTAMSIKRLTQDWGEGTSVNAVDKGTGAPATIGDATWNRRFFNTHSWTGGGTYSGTTSASATVPVSVPLGGVMMTWGSTAAMVSDVQAWLNTPATSYGWILLGDEANDTTACQFASIQKGPTPPALIVTYNAAPQPTHFEAWIAQYFPANLVGQYVDPNGDLDGDGIKNQVEYSYGFSPVAANPADAGLQISSAEDGPNTVFTITFRRDPLATDLTYALETSSDLVNWSVPPIVQSAGGADSTGSGVISDSDIIGEEPMRLVTARETG
ncbi:MAG: PQQ-dependent sugar dehydrogenase [Chthoniobacteraceae bacterium]